ncbi:hypothetical protein WR25_24300 [Diploscapter pachys]|uniref:Uncharacterized protein n=1 Tax=Diploscapter pachys TaxID=2018661 RepID=A0A2A2LR94_9BILA|nr:hypothetical protein WR25_24300 [Diploscapter pachys]
MPSSPYYAYGSIKLLRIRVTLDRAESALPGMMHNRNGDEVVGMRRVDELLIQWQQKISPFRESKQADSARVEQRLFTQIEEEPLAEQLRPQMSELMKDIAAKGKIKSMHVIAYLGTLTGEYESFDEQRVVSIFHLDDRLFFDPVLDGKPISLPSRFGEYRAHVSVLDDYFSPMAPIPYGSEQIYKESSEFVIPRDRATSCLMQIELSTGSQFASGEELRVESSVVYNGQTIHQQTCTRTARSVNGIVHFCELFEVSFSISELDPPILVMRITSSDTWGRHQVIGYGSASLLPLPGRRVLTASFGKPIDKSGELTLRQVFTGQSVDVDYVKLILNAPNNRLNITMSPSGTMEIRLNCIIQGRHLIAKDTLKQLKYGMMIGKIGLSADLYMRVMRVLMEFEEARRQLLSLRPASKIH